MERMKELEENISEYRNVRSKIKKAYMAEHESKLEPIFREKLNILVSEQIQSQQEKNQDKVKYIFLCRLFSSGYTESYEAIMGMCSSMLYLDEKQSQVYWYPELIYESINQDMEAVKKSLLKNNFHRLEEYELFQLRQKLICDDWNVLQESFRSLVETNLHHIIDSSLLLEKELIVLYGDYMDELQVIWHVKTERSRRI